MARTTIDVRQVLDMANCVFANPDNPVEAKQAIAFFLERILTETGNYRGFRYVNLTETRRPSAGGVWDEQDEWSRTYSYSRELQRKRRKATA